MKILKVYFPNGKPVTYYVYSYVHAKEILRILGNWVGYSLVTGGNVKDWE